MQVCQKSIFHTEILITGLKRSPSLTRRRHCGQSQVLKYRTWLWDASCHCGWHGNVSRWRQPPRRCYGDVHTWSGCYLYKFTCAYIVIAACAHQPSRCTLSSVSVRMGNRFQVLAYYTVSGKKGATWFFAVTLPNPNRPSKFFYLHTQQ